MEMVKIGACGENFAVAYVMASLQGQITHLLLTMLIYFPYSVYPFQF